MILPGRSVGEQILVKIFVFIPFAALVAVGERPFASRDKAANFWPLAILSMGESWHNSHHADPTCARHGVLKGQIDISARVIWIFEKLGWASNVRWTNPERLARITART